MNGQQSNLQFSKGQNGMPSTSNKKCPYYQVTLLNWDFFCSMILLVGTIDGEFNLFEWKHNFATKLNFNSSLSYFYESLIYLKKDNTNKKIKQKIKFNKLLI